MSRPFTSPRLSRYASCGSGTNPIGIMCPREMPGPLEMRSSTALFLPVSSLSSVLVGQRRMSPSSHSPWTNDATVNGQSFRARQMTVQAPELVCLRLARRCLGASELWKKQAPKP
ncbi:hypothetical protein N657DRAFT_376696 [Parathielavia appendiculata]|uniref:Uncharacterized protein n=1 Tax=Parathielavia appendiculata TaxID=2587402 RepID=A0AAN6U0L8_9PEZI|nr:hypothetical protein N657DRAFT_376696 [Parathielavia appendiculata]